MHKAFISRGQSIDKWSFLDCCQKVILFISGSFNWISVFPKMLNLCSSQHKNYFLVWAQMFFTTIVTVLETGKHRFVLLRCISLRWRRGHLAQWTIVYYCSAAPQYVLFHIRGIPAKFYPVYPYHRETDWWKEDKTRTRLWARHMAALKTNAPYSSDISVEPIRRSQILHCKWIWTTKWTHIVQGFNSLLLQECWWKHPVGTVVQYIVEWAFTTVRPELYL